MEMENQFVIARSGVGVGGGTDRQRTGLQGNRLGVLPPGIGIGMGERDISLEESQKYLPQTEATKDWDFLEDYRMLSLPHTSPSHQQVSSLG